MKFAKILAGTAVASLAIFTNVGAPIGVTPVPAAQAQAQVSFSIFYDELADHGDWVRYRDAYVFIPSNVDRGWRPYTRGHWVYANDYGWTWASDEPFGWATYHYGRWGYARDIGWYWVPGTRWAPAWVSWRRSNDHVVWAPLPPRGGTEVSVEISVGDIPDFYWVAVPTRSFLDVDLRVNIIDNDRDRRIIERAEYLGTPRVRNNIVINTVIDIDIIERDTGKKVRRVEARKSNDLREARATDDQVTVFEGEVQAEADAKPKRVKKVEEVKKVTVDEAATEDAAQSVDQDAEGQIDDKAAGTTTDADDANAKLKAGKNAKSKAEDQAESTGAAGTKAKAAEQVDDQTEDAAAPDTKKKKAKPAQAEAPAANTEAEAEAQVDTPAANTEAEAEAQVETPAADKKTNAKLRKDEAGEQASESQKLKKKNTSDDDVTTGSTGKAKKPKKDKECDPEDADCQAQ
jgi:hypothetical protein